MIALIQRVSRASVDISEKEVAAIGAGLMVLLGIQVDDTDKEARKLAQKTCLLYTSPSPRDATLSRMPSSA